MTVLYRLDATAAQVAAQFGAAAGSDPWRGGHIGPGQFAPVLTQGREAIAGPGRAGQPLRMSRDCGVYRRRACRSIRGAAC